MAVLSDILSSVIDLAQATNPYAVITVGPLPKHNGISITMASGNPTNTYLDKGESYELVIVCNGKHAVQQTAINAIDKIHVELTQAIRYPSTNEYQITDISTISSPSYLDHESSGQWLYGSSLKIKFYMPKG